MNIDRIKNINKQYLDNSIKSNKDIKVEKRDDIINIEISDTAKAIINRINQSKDSGISERVEVIRQAIISGNYKVSSEEIADKIINILESQKGCDIE
jgi:anti-sigma28 factor (negative regulator of flagellin synthesis)